MCCIYDNTPKCVKGTREKLTSSPLLHITMEEQQVITEPEWAGIRNPNAGTKKKRHSEIKKNF